MMNTWELKNRTKELIAFCIKMRIEEPKNQLLQELVNQSLPVLEDYLRRFEQFS